MTKRHQHISDHEQWLDHVKKVRGEKDIVLLQSALQLYGVPHSPLIEKGVMIADILLSLELDNETLAAALIYPALQAQEIPLEKILDQLGEECSKLLHDVMQMQSLGKLPTLHLRGNQQVENLRKMLLAMVTDVRSILIILAERLWKLYQAKNKERDVQEKLAKETLEVYAPLANRIGVWQLKWEIEDYCLRYLQPETYTEIAKWLASRRAEREVFITHAIEVLSDTLKKAHIKDFQVSGRVKHIYSIYRKMQRKNASFEDIYDISALRVLVNNIDDCYAVLSVLQNNWQQVPKEFDDYIALPKPNGYRSIHTVIVGPEERFIEVQIRTYDMHHESELGVAAHWRYKEGVLQTSSYEAKIALLRQINAWQKEIVKTAAPVAEQPTPDLFDEQVYVFTPLGDIIDLQKGATPLDFAYHIHSEVGHRCRGAKVDGHIVPLTYELQTGQRIEILTTKEANPSRDWLSPQRGFLKTARARAKVAHWFRVKDGSQHPVNEPKVAQVQPQMHSSSSNEIKLDIRPPKSPSAAIQILGIDNLLTHNALCCKPLPGDSVIGYVTRNRGVTVHRRDCTNLAHITLGHEQRLMEVNWGEKESSASYPADLQLRITDRSGLLRDITTLLSNEKINILGLQTQALNDPIHVDIYLTIQITGKEQLQKALDLLNRIPNVLEVRRR